MPAIVWLLLAQVRSACVTVLRGRRNLVPTSDDMPDSKPVRESHPTCECLSPAEKWDEQAQC